MKTSNMSKLRFYRKYKSDHYKIERYITLLKITEDIEVVWQSSDAVHIDSKLKLVGILKFIMNIPLGMDNYQEKKRICDICKDKVADEQHFILECKLNENLRQDLFSNLEIKHIQPWNETEKIKCFFETASESDLQKFAKFVSNSFEKQRKYSNKA